MSKLVFSSPFPLPLSPGTLLVAWIMVMGWFPEARSETPRGPAPLTGIYYKAAPSSDAYETERCLLDLYLPGPAAEGQEKFPVLVWFHGGGLTGGVKDDGATTAIARRFAASGVAVAAVNYRLSPKAHYPAYAEDAAASVAWVRRNIAGHGGDPARVFVGGHSAGGYLALMAGLDTALQGRHGLDLKSIAGIIPVAGQTLTHYTIREERGLPKERLLADAAAPVNHVTASAAPLLILYAEHDMAMRAEENQLFAAAMKNAGHRSVEIRMIAGSDHGSVGNDLSKAGNAGFEIIREFIRKNSP